MNEEVLKMISKMKIGDITPVINTPTGGQIFKLESSIDSTTLPFEAARGQIADKLGQQKIGSELKKYVQRLRAQAIIEWKNDEIRKAWEVGVSAEPTY